MQRAAPRILSVLLLGSLIGFLPARGASAADTLLGEPWEAGIRDGIQRQDRERTKRQAETILRQAKLLAARPAQGAQQVVRVYLLARAYGIAGDAGSARDTYAELLRLAPRCYYAYHDLAMLDLARTPPDARSAEANLRRAIGLNPGYLAAQRKLSMVLLEADRVDEAIDFLRRIVDGEPADMQARFLLARTLLARDRVADAEREVAMLLRREPGSPAFQELKAQVYVKRGRLDDALAVYRRLAVENPGVPSPLQGYLRCLDLKREQTEEVDLEQYLWALEGLYRLERDPEQRAKLEQAIQDMRNFEARAGAPAAADQGPPSDAQIAAKLHELPDDGRPQVLRYVYSRAEPPSADLLKAVMRRLAPSVEPLPAVRAWALRILGRFGGFGLVGLVRHSLNDPSAEVRPVAVDAVVQLARTGGPAEATAVLALGRAAASSDPALATAARAGLAELIKAPWKARAKPRSAPPSWLGGTGPRGRRRSSTRSSASARRRTRRPRACCCPTSTIPTRASWPPRGAGWARRPVACSLDRGRTPPAPPGFAPCRPPAAPDPAAAKAAKPRLDAWLAAKPR